MWAYVVIGPPEGIEDALLEVEIRRRRFRDLGLERLVHAFVGAVLLRATWRDALMSDSELQPPDVQSAEAVNSGRGKGCAVVAANGARQAMLAKEAKELRLDAVGAHVEQAVTAEQVPAEVVDDGQGITVDTVAHQELPFEVDGPDLIWCGRVEGRGTRMLPSASAAPRLGPAMALQDVEDRAARGP